MAMKIDTLSIVLGAAIAVAGLAVYDYYVWTSGGVFDVRGQGV